MVTVKGIAIAPKVMAPMERRDAVDVAVESGIDGDARGRKRGRQITLLFEDDWRDAVDAAGGDALSWTARRANILISGMRAPQHEGGVFSIGDVRLEVAMETDPCDLMEKTRPGLRDALTPDWRGGVCCRVLSGGHIAIGDSVAYEEDGG